MGLAPQQAIPVSWQGNQCAGQAVTSLMLLLLHAHTACETPGVPGGREERGLGTVDSEGGGLAPADAYGFHCTQIMGLPGVPLFIVIGSV
jgi:hypothetical protein